VLAIALDAEAHDQIKGLAPSVHYVGSRTPETTGAVSRFGDRSFIDICIRRIEAIADVLRLGYNMLFLDVDIAMLRDPMPILAWNSADWSLSVDKGYLPK
jgi:hypothetical protein